MRIACLDHPYHRTTGSSSFLHDLLRRLGTVDRYFPRTGAGDLPPESPPFDPGAYDIVVIYQVHEAFRLVPEEHPNVVFVPMYDSHVLDGCFYWSRAFERGKVLCFSAALYEQVAQRTARAAWFQYFPDPEAFPAVEDYRSPRGFFWMRRASFGPGLIARVAAGVEFEEFHVHLAPDPGEGLPAAEALGVRTRKLRTSEWFAGRDEYIECVRRANVYFAPRLVEGIGLGFLEAMAMGLCVVAPDTPTHNEYISPGVNGALYDPRRPEAVDLSRFSDLGRRARESVVRGRRRWEASLDDLFEFILTPTAEFRPSRFTAAGWLERPPRLSRPAAKAPERPSVAVAVCGCEPAGACSATLESALRQDYPRVECLLVAGKGSRPPADLLDSGAVRLVRTGSPEPVTAAAAVEAALRTSSAAWFLLLEPGEILISPDALRRLLAGVPAEAAAVYGHHVERSLSGSEQYFRTWGLALLAERLRGGEADLRWLAAVPLGSAAAWSRTFLERHRPDPRLRAAARAELLFRLERAGADVYHADEFIAAGAGREPPWRREGAWEEWVEVVERYGGPAAGEAMRRARDVTRDSRWSAGPGPEAGLPTSPGRAGAPGRAAAARWIARAAAAFRRVRFGKPFVLSPAPLDLGAELAGAVYASYPATLPEGADFSRPGLPAFLRTVRGLSLREDWGRWSDGPRVEFEFRCMLPRRFVLAVRGYAVGGNAERPVRVRAGGCVTELRMRRPPARDYEVRLELREPAHTLVFEIPCPATPRELWGTSEHDMREVGVGFERLALRPL